MDKFGNFGFDGEDLKDSDFNDFYFNLVSSQPTGTFTPPSQTGQKTTFSSPIGSFIPQGQSSPAKEPAKTQKGGFLKGLGNFLSSEQGRATIMGVSQGLERQGVGGTGGYEPSPDERNQNNNQPQGLSTPAMIGIGVGLLVVVGLGFYFITKNNG